LLISIEVPGHNEAPLTPARERGSFAEKGEDF